LCKKENMYLAISYNKKIGIIWFEKLIFNRNRKMKKLPERMG